MMRFKAFLAICCAVAIFMSATFAYEEIFRARNVFHNRRPTDEVTIHDDFDPDVGQKDVFVENVGNVPLYVRVKLQEYMDLTTDYADPADHQWITHKYNISAANCGLGMNGALFHDYFTWTMGGQKWYMPGKTSPNSIVNDKGIDYTGVPGAKQTPNASITTSAMFLAMTAQQQKDYVGWIFSPDGYAYWSKPLLGGDATGLLLHGVTISDKIKKETYYYAINVVVEVVDDMDLPMWTSGAQPVAPGNKHPEADADGKEIIKIVVGNGTTGSNNDINGILDADTGTRYLIDNKEWLKIRNDYIDGREYVLLMLKDVVGPFAYGYNSQNELQFADSLARTQLAAWYDNLAAPTLKSMAVPALTGTAPSKSWPAKENTGIYAHIPRKVDTDLLAPQDLIVKGQPWWLANPISVDGLFNNQVVVRGDGSMGSRMNESSDVYARPMIWIRVP